MIKPDFFLSFLLRVKNKSLFSRLNIEQDHPGLATNLAGARTQSPDRHRRRRQRWQQQLGKKIKMKKKLGFKLRWEYHDAAAAAEVETLAAGFWSTG